MKSLCVAEFLSREAAYVLEEDVRLSFAEEECEGMEYASMGWIEDDSGVLSGHWCCILLGFKVEMEDRVVHDRLAAVAREVGMECQCYRVIKPWVETTEGKFVCGVADELVKRLGFAREVEGRLRAGSVQAVVECLDGELTEWKRLLDLWGETVLESTELVSEVRKKLVLIIDAPGKERCTEWPVDGGPIVVDDMTSN
jgi:hypothetical protein